MALISAILLPMSVSFAQSDNSVSSESLSSKLETLKQQLIVMLMQQIADLTKQLNDLIAKQQAQLNTQSNQIAQIQQQVQTQPVVINQPEQTATVSVPEVVVSTPVIITKTFALNSKELKDLADTVRKTDGRLVSYYNSQLFKDNSKYRNLIINCVGDHMMNGLNWTPSNTAKIVTTTEDESGMILTIQLTPSLKLDIDNMTDHYYSSISLPMNCTQTSKDMHFTTSTTIQ